MSTLNRALTPATAVAAEASQVAGSNPSGMLCTGRSEGYVTTKDGVSLYYKDWGRATGRWSPSAMAGR